MTRAVAVEARAPRVGSVDVLRGLFVLLMLFVNDLASVPGAPAFLRHKAANDDGMTITDAVFPGFLFVVGVAIPLALGSRLRRGEPRHALLRHVVLRSASLVLVGVLMVNAEHARPGPLSPHAWNALMTLGVLLAWALPVTLSRRHSALLRAAGVALLVVAAVTYRGDGVTGLVQLRPYWWGILGLIGWAYLGAASLYLAIGDRPAILTGALALYGCVALADDAGGFGWPAIRGPLVGGVIGTHGAVVLGGVLLGVMLARQRRDRGPAEGFVADVLGYAAALGAGGLLLHTLAEVHRAFTISKIHATLPWGLVSAALAAVAFAVVFVFADVLGRVRWPRVVGAAGENALLAYLLAPLLVSLVALVAPLTGGSLWEAAGQPLALGLARAVVVPVVVVGVAAWLRGWGVRLRL